MLEIYNEEARDLLIEDGGGMRIRENPATGFYGKTTHLLWSMLMHIVQYKIYTTT